MKPIPSLTLEEVFYAAFERKGLDRVGISRDTVQDLRVLGRHVDKLHNTLPPIASHVDFCIKERTIVECYCALVPLLRQSMLSDDNAHEAINLAKKLATSFREIWCSPNDLFPYFHMCDSESEHELRYVHATHHVGVGAFMCQGVEPLGHQVKVDCPSTGWCPRTFLAKLLCIIELRHATPCRGF